MALGGDPGQDPVTSLNRKAHPRSTIGAHLKGMLHCPLLRLFTIHPAFLDEVDKGMSQCGEAVVLVHEVFLSLLL